MTRFVTVQDNNYEFIINLKSMGLSKIIITNSHKHKEQIHIYTYIYPQPNTVICKRLRPDMIFTPVYAVNILERHPIWAMEQ